MKHCLILLVFLSAQVCAQRLTLIYDAGDSLPIDPYLPNPVEVSNPGEVDRPGGSVDVSSLFPITSPSLSPGMVETRAFDIPYLQTPIFVIGYDPMSLEWLGKAAPQLLKLGAIGMVVSVDDEKQLHEIRNLAGSLRLVPVSGEALSQFLGISHYPVLISKQGIEQ